MCISYLNSWQSYKNRCGAAQRKQRDWLATHLKQQLGLGKDGEGESMEQDPDAVSLTDDGTDAYNYYPEYHRAQGNKVSEYDGCADERERN